MNFKLRIAAATIMAVSVVASYGQTSAAKAPAKKHVVTAKTKTPPPPTIAEQIQALRQELENQARQIESLPRAKPDICGVAMSGGLDSSHPPQCGLIT